MSEVEAALQRLREIHAQLPERLAKVEEERFALLRERDDALRAAKAAGATYQAIHAATGLANASITKALGRP